jgi:hypothetical protein
MSGYVNAAQCESCWIEDNATWDPDTPGVLVELRMPVRLVEPVVEQCAWCGGPTIFGVYVRVARTILTYPPSVDDD